MLIAIISMKSGTYELYKRVPWKFIPTSSVFIPHNFTLFFYYGHKAIVCYQRRSIFAWTKHHWQKKQWHCQYLHYLHYGPSFIMLVNKVLRNYWCISNKSTAEEMCFHYVQVKGLEKYSCLLDWNCFLFLFTVSHLHWWTLLVNVKKYEKIVIILDIKSVFASTLYEVLKMKHKYCYTLLTWGI